MGATLVRLAPGYGVTEEELDSRLSAQSLQAIRHSQVFEGNIASFYLHHCGRLLHGDLGVSSSLHVPVRQLIAERLPETLKSVGIGTLLGWVAGLGLALIVVITRSPIVDLATSLGATIVLCVPAAVLALLCVIARVPGRVVIAVVVFPKVFQYARNLLVRNAALPHVITATSKGLSSARVFWWHILPMVAPELFAVAGVTITMAFAAAIPVEALCDLPGLGQLAWKAALSRDLEVLVSLTMIVTLITLFANTAAEGLGRALARR